MSRTYVSLKEISKISDSKSWDEVEDIISDAYNDTINIVSCKHCRYFDETYKNGLPQDYGICMKYNVEKDSNGYCDEGDEK